MAALGLRQFPQEPSPSLTVVQLPDGLDGQALQKLIHDKYQVVFIGGQDELRGKVLRWSHMGHSSWQEQILIARALASGLEDAGAKLPEGWRDWLREKSEQLL